MSIAVNFRAFRFPRNVVASTFGVRLLLLAIPLAVAVGGCTFFLGDDALRQPLSAPSDPLPDRELSAEVTAPEPETPLSATETAETTLAAEVAPSAAAPEPETPLSATETTETAFAAEVAPNAETKPAAPPDGGPAALNDAPVSLSPSFSLDFPADDDAFFFDESAFGVVDEDGGDSLFFDDLPSANRTLVATIQFDRGSSALNDRDREILHQVVLLQSQRGGRLYVVGHASSYTDDMPIERHQQINLAVSAKRAKRVADALYHLGAQSDSIETDAASDARPIYYEIMPAGEAGNRRAEIYLEP